jgi:hypothetical protein
MEKLMAVLGILFAAFGMAWAVVALAIAARCAELYGADSVQGRAVLGVGLAFMSFVGAYIDPLGSSRKLSHANA